MYDLDLLESEAADIPRRHRSLRAVFEHSWALLCQDEQQLLAQLSVFEGGLSKEAAQQVAQANLRTLLALVNKSLLRRSDSGRFEMLETIRHYATEKLASDQPMLTETKVRHARYFLSLAETASTKLSGAEQTKWLGHITTDHDNLRLALDWSLQTHHADMSLRLVAALWWFWQVCGHLQEGKAWLERVLALPETATPSKIRAKALRGAGVIAWMQGDLDTAKVHFTEALRILAELGDEHDTARVLNNLGILFYLQRDYERAEQTLHQGLELFRQLSDEYNTASALGNLGLVTYMRGDLEATQRTCEEVLTRFQGLNDFWGTAISHSNLARVLCSQGHYAEAAVHYRIGIELAHQNGAQRLLASLFEGLARLFAYVDAPIYAATLWGAAETLRNTLGAPREPIDEVDYSISIRKTKTATQATLFERAWEQGKHTGLEDVVTFALTQTISYTSS
jgi:non-specific serine/threonine protein kinase